ncbi:MAG: rhamnulokinase [Fibrobacteria bacterium]|nr:rhamnulokinase [Fibrobacteria bacterium]
MKNEYLAFDLGASSVRTILGRLEDGKLQISEVNRFYNGIARMFGHCYWDYTRLFDSMKKGLQLAWQEGARPVSLAVDTWGLDFALFTRDNEFCGQPYAYRDPHTAGMMEKLFEVVPKKRIYELTGIQFMQINSLVQLFALVQNHSPQLEIARSILMVPDIFNYLFTGVKKAELTFASTTQFFNPHTRDWAEEILKAIGISKDMLPEIVEPGTVLGSLDKDLCGELGITTMPVIAVGSHDTASAVVSVPTQSDDYAYISAGTWCLMGIEEPKPVITAKTMEYNFSNEQGVFGTTRLLKNVMGLWMIQECRRILLRERNYSFVELVALAQKAKPFKALIDPDYPAFLNPPDMIESLRDYCQKTTQPVPESVGEFIRVIIEGLALKFAVIAEQLREVSANPVNRIHIIGGGCQNELLNQFTANAAGVPVVAGPVEATATGNLLMQAVAMQHISTLSEARQIVAESNNCKRYEPQDRKDWEEALIRFKEII